MAGSGVLLPGQGWMVSRTVRTWAGPDGEWEVGWEVEHRPVVAWVSREAIGLVPMTVRNGLTATPSKELSGVGTLLWHPDVTSREDAEAELLAEAEGGG